MTEKITKTAPCDDFDYAEHFSPEEIIYGGDMPVDRASSLGPEQSPRLAIINSGNIIDKLEDLGKAPQMRGEVKTYEDALARSAVASGELITRQCATCELADDCDQLKPFLEAEDKKGDQVMERINERYLASKAKADYLKWLDAQGKHDIRRSQKAQHEFAAKIREIEQYGITRNKLISTIALNLDEKHIDRFDSFLFGVAAELIAYEQTEEMCNGVSGWSIRPATAEEDMYQGTDFLVVIPTENGPIEVPIDAKSKTAYKKILDKQEGPLTVVDDGRYASIISPTNRGHILVVNPEGKSDKSKLYGTRIIKTKAGSKAVSDFEVDEETAATFRENIEEGVRLILSSRLKTAHPMRPLPATFVRK